MHRVKGFGRVFAGSVAAAAIAVSGMGVAAASKGAAYKVTEAKLDVIEVAKYSSTSSPSAWDGAGDVHHALPDDQGEIPALPQSLLAGKQNSVAVFTDEFSDGIENLVNAEGEKDECSGSWELEEDDQFVVGLKETKDKLVSIWEIPTGISSANCGVVYDILDGPIKTKGKGSGHVGGAKIVLETRGSKKDSELSVTTTLEQSVKWEGKVMLKRVKNQNLPAGLSVT